MTTEFVEPPVSASERMFDVSIDSIVAYIDRHVDSAIRVKTLAALAGMRELEFSRVFRGRMGLTPYQWVIRKRVTKARDLLSKTTLPMAEIAYLCGFSSQSHMTSLLSRRLGLTPTQIRSG